MILALVRRRYNAVGPINLQMCRLFASHSTTSNNFFLTFLKEGHPETAPKIYTVPHYILFGKVALLISDYSNYNKRDDAQKVAITKTKGGP